MDHRLAAVSRLSSEVLAVLALLRWWCLVVDLEVAVAMPELVTSGAEAVLTSMEQLAVINAELLYPRFSLKVTGWFN